MRTDTDSRADSHVRNPAEWVLSQFEAPASLGHRSEAEYFGVGAAGRPDVQRLAYADLGAALREGWQDFAAARTDLVFLWVVYPILALFIAGAEYYGMLIPLFFPLASGFALVGPFAAVGLYEMSRRREQIGETRWRDSFAVFSSPAIWRIFALGALLFGLFLVWIALAWLLYTETLGPQPPVSPGAFLAATFGTAGGWSMIVIGVAIGALFAAASLALSVVSFPLMLDRPVGLGTAIATSVRAVRENPGPLAAWGLIVAASLLLGAIPIFVGLIVALPVLGHATWHLYRRLIRPLARQQRAAPSTAEVEEHRGLI